MPRPIALQRVPIMTLSTTVEPTGHALTVLHPAQACAAAQVGDNHAACGMTGYKRPDLLFTGVQRLRSINAHFPFQVVVAGKAHPCDEQGKQLIRDIMKRMRQLSPAPRMAYLPAYVMAQVLRLGRRRRYVVEYTAPAA